MTVCIVEGCRQPKRATNGMCGMHYQRWRRCGSTELPTRYATCTVEGCGRSADHKILGLCEAHYYQNRRHGRIVSVEIGVRLPHASRPTECKEPGCEKQPKTLGWCSMHYARWRRHGDPGSVHKRGSAPGETNPAWRGDDVGYSAVHGRLRRIRGAAPSHQCQHCGDVAKQWAYDRTDPNERTDPAAGPYSTDLARYMPLCVPCHKRFDLASIRASA